MNSIKKILFLFVCIAIYILPTTCCNYSPSFHDTYLLCKIFENTNIDDNVWWWHSNEQNYCSLIQKYPQIQYYNVFNCSSDNINITHINLGDYYYIHGTLNTSIAWPKLLRVIDLERLGTNPSEWSWESITDLIYLYKVDLDDLNVYGRIDNNVWNKKLTTLPNLKYLYAKNNDFEANFSDIHIDNHTFDNMEYLLLRGNNFVGEMSMDFIKAFPNIRYFDFGNMNITLNLRNFDILTELQSLEQFRMDNCDLYGQIFVSTDNIKRLPPTLKEIDIDYNSFSGPVQWNIFDDSYDLEVLELGHNYLNGTIDWSIIGKLSKQALVYLDLEGNNFNGYADFSDLAHDGIEIHLDKNIHCDPILYICNNTAIPVDRANVRCVGRENCEQTCRCSDGLIPRYSPYPIHLTNAVKTTDVIKTTTIFPSITAYITAIHESDIYSSTVSMVTDGNSKGMMLLGVFATLLICCIACLMVIMFTLYYESKKMKNIKQEQQVNNKRNKHNDKIIHSMSPSLETPSPAPASVAVVIKTNHQISRALGRIQEYEQSDIDHLQIPGIPDFAPKQDSKNIYGNLKIIGGIADIHIPSNENDAGIVGGPPVIGRQPTFIDINVDNIELEGIHKKSHLYDDSFEVQFVPERKLSESTSEDLYRRNIRQTTITPFTVTGTPSVSPQNTDDEHNEDGSV